MKKLLFALALTSFVGGSAFAHEGDKDKTAKKGEKRECSVEAKASCAKTAGKPSCCASKNKTASLITPAPKEDVKAEKKATL